MDERILLRTNYMKVKDYAESKNLICEPPCEPEWYGIL